MTSGFESSLNDMLAEIQKQREELMRFQRGVPEISGSARSKRRQVSAVVDARGDLVELKFHGSAFRSLASAELANIIVETIRDARAEAHRQLWDVVGESFPGGTGFAELVSGDYDWTESMSLPKPLLDLLQAPPPARHFPVARPADNRVEDDDVRVDEDGARADRQDAAREDNDSAESGRT